jgi:hypothetical protein
VEIERKVYQGKRGKENHQGAETKFVGEEDQGWKGRDWKDDRIRTGQRKKMKD